MPFCEKFLTDSRKNCPWTFPGQPCAKAGIVPLAIFSPLAARCCCTSSNSARPRSCCRADGGTGIPWSRRADKTPHRQRIVERLLHRRVRKIEPLLQEIEAQHPLDPDRRAAIAGLGIVGLDHRAQRRPRHHARHLGQKRRPPGRPSKPLKPRHRQAQLPHSPNPLCSGHPGAHYTESRRLLQRFLNHLENLARHI